MYTVGILTISDKGSRGERRDDSGPAIRQCLDSYEAQVVQYKIVPDEKDAIAEHLKVWSDEAGVDVIITTGGTGLAPRDVTPEATLSIIEKLVPGIPEAMRLQSLKKTPTAMLSRAVAGIRGHSLIINLPGSPKACRECMEVILPALPHAIETLQGKSNECASRIEGKAHAH
jgi:molybdopterin adenylyltransferase